MIPGADRYACERAPSRPAQRGFSRSIDELTKVQCDGCRHKSREELADDL